METNELQILWQTLANEKLIGKEIAREHINRIIAMKSSKTMSRLNKKLKNDFILNISSALFIVAATIFTTLFNTMHHRVMSLNGYLFLLLTFAFFTFKSLNQFSKMKMLQLSFTTFSIKESLEKVRNAFKTVSKKEEIITYFVFTIIVVYANIVLNEIPGFSKFNFNSLQGYVLVISVFSLILGPFVNRLIFKKRFSGIIDDLTHSIDDLTKEME